MHAKKKLSSALVLLGCFSLLSCSSDTNNSDAASTIDSGVDAGAPDTTAPLNKRFGGSRPVNLAVPKNYDGKKALPLVFVLHGYSANGFVQTRLLGFHTLVEKQEILLAAPEGTINAKHKQFWNATDACCDFFDTKVDDVAYLAGLIKEISDVYNVDKKRVYLIGHSNGGFMAYRMACDRADLIAGIISLAGASFASSSKCKPSEPVSVLQIHGDKDDSVLFGGGSVKSPDAPATSKTYPGALESTSNWASYNGCKTTTKKEATTLDLDSSVAGAESEVLRFEGCPSGIDVELWTIVGGSHLPLPTPTFTNRAWDFFAKHPKL